MRKISDSIVVKMGCWIKKCENFILFYFFVIRLDWLFERVNVILLLFIVIVFGEIGILGFICVGLFMVIILFLFKFDVIVCRLL